MSVLAIIKPLAEGQITLKVLVSARLLKLNSDKPIQHLNNNST